MAVVWIGLIERIETNWTILDNVSNNFAVLFTILSMSMHSIVVNCIVVHLIEKKKSVEFLMVWWVKFVVNWSIHRTQWIWILIQQHGIDFIQTAAQ